MPPRTGRAAVEIVGDVANFGAEVERDLNKELRSVDIDVGRVADDISTGIQDGVDKAGRSFDGLNTKAKSSLGGIGAEAEKAGASISDGVRKGTDQARDEFGRFIASGQKSSRDFSFSFENITKVLGGIGKAAGTALTMGIKVAAVASAANTAAQLVVALAPAVGALGVLPAAFIASKVAAGTFQLAVMGVADAVSAGLTGDTEAFNEALKQMPPTAQAAMKEILSLKGEILGVRTAVQGNFFAPLVGNLKPLGEALLPSVTRQLALISGGFGAAAAESAKFLTMPSSVAAVNSALGATGVAINNLTSGVPGLVRAFLPLWEVGSSFLPGLTGGFDGLTQRIGAFMEKAQETGQLQEFISGGLSALGELGTVLGQVGSILGSVFQAASAAGGGLLGVVGQAVGQFAAFLNTAEGMSALTSVFEVLGGVAGLLGQALAVVLPVVGKLVGVLGSALKPIIPVISSAIAQMAPIIAQLGEALGAILGPAIGVVVQLLSTLIPVIMPIVSALLGALMPVITALAPVVTALGQVISTILGAALTALMPIFTALLPVISQLLTAVLTPLVPVLGLVGDLFLALMPALQPLIGLAVQLLTYALKPLSITIPIVAKVLEFLIKVIIAIIDPIARAIGWVATFLTKLLQSQSVKDNVVKAWNAIKTATSAVFGFVKNYITAVWNTIKTVTSAVWGFIKSYITTQINIIKAVFRTIGAVISAVIGFFNRMRAGAISALNALRAGVASAVSAVIGFFGRLASGAASKISSLISTVRGIGGKIRAAVGNLAGLLVNAGRNVIQGLINGIGQKLGALRAKISSAASAIREFLPFSPAKTGPLSGKGSPEKSGSKIATMISEGMERRIPEIRAAAAKAALATQGPVSGARKTKLQIFRESIANAKAAAERARAAADALRGGTGSSGGGGGGGGGGDGVTYIFASGSIILNFYGIAPGDETAYSAGRAAGRGLADSFAAANVRTTVRTI